MGVVYEAYDRERTTRVALKTIRFYSADALLRFKNEFRSLQDVRHRNLVSLGELVEDAGHWFFTMELVEGVDLLRYVRPGVDPSPAPTPGPASIARTRLRPADSEMSSDAEPTVNPTPPPPGLPPPSDPAYDEPRLRSAMRQLAEGLLALHAAGKVHRDIKPSNMRITPEGRVVLLDFGLVTEAFGDRTRTDASVVGTTYYMAPEQGFSQPVGAPADWYSVGVVLYEALTGRVPFGGHPMEVLLNKQRLDPPPPRILVPAVPQDLDLLCCELLRRIPEERPTGRELLRRLRTDGEPALVPALEPEAVPPRPPFVGRGDELDALRRAFEDAGAGRAVTVVVDGDSGVGKTALVQRFIDELTAARRGTVVLCGRCFEQESVPYKAIDGVIDALSRWMRRLPVGEAAALLPRRASLLAQAFPVLNRVEVIAGAPRPAVPITDAHELRRRVFEALRELFVRLSERHSVVVAIDDMQWADTDSRSLLAELIRSPEPPPLLLVLAQRTGTPARPGEKRSDGSGRGPVDAAAALPGEVRRLRLGNLPPDDARELVQTLFQGTALKSPIPASALADEAHGHPRFIEELVRHVMLLGAQAPRAVGLGEVLWARIDRLDPPARELLELVCLAGGPVPQATVAAAWTAGGRADLLPAVSALKVAHLVQTGGPLPSDPIETCHDLVRVTVGVHMSPESRLEARRRLAQALEAAATPDAELLAHHWLEVGERDKAAGWALQAGDRAAQALAFDRAARMYRLALELGARTAPPDPALAVKLADSLANAGRCAEAGPLFLEAAARAEGFDRIDLQRKGTEQLLRSGHINEALRAVSDLVAQVGLSLPATPRRALVYIALERLRLAVRGMRFRRREEHEVPRELLARADVCWSVGYTLSAFDPLRGGLFHMRHLRLALDAGEPHRLARGLANEATQLAFAGPRAARRAARVAAQAEALARELADPDALGHSVLHDGFRAFLEWRLRAAVELLDRAVALFRERGSLAWETGTAHVVALLSLNLIGDVRELSRRLPELVRRAEERGDLWTSVFLRMGHEPFLALARDDVDAARKAATDPIRRWSPEGFYIQHSNELMSEATVEVYAGDAARGLRMIRERWGAMQRSGLFLIQLIRVTLTELRARAALAAAGAAATSAPEAEALVRAARADARRLAKEVSPGARAFAEAIRAGAAALGGDRAAAATALESAASAYADSDMALRAAAARRRLGELKGGEEGRALVEAADGWMRDHGIARPDRMAALFVPGFGR